MRNQYPKMPRETQFMNRPDKICLCFVVEGTVDETRGKFQTEATKDVTISDSIEERSR
jgi:hypothetical protein